MECHLAHFRYVMRDAKWPAHVACAQTICASKPCAAINRSRPPRRWIFYHNSCEIRHKDAMKTGSVGRQRQACFRTSRCKCLSVAPRSKRSPSQDCVACNCCAPRLRINPLRETHTCRTMTSATGKEQVVEEHYSGQHALLRAHDVAFRL